jgi:hypothetical protein
LAFAKAKVFSNESELVQENISESELGNLSLLRPLPNFRIKSGENISLDMSSYFSGATSL